MNNQVRSIKCAQCGLTHFFSGDGVCPNCGAFVRLKQPGRSKTPIFILIGVIALLCLGAVLVIAKVATHGDEQSQTVSRQSFNSQRAIPPGEPVKEIPNYGLTVMSVDGGGPAMAAGVQTGDIVIQYGDAEVRDDASFFAAQEDYARRPTQDVSLGVVRQGMRINLTVPQGLLGFYTQERNLALLNFYSLMNKIDFEEQLTSEQLAQAKGVGGFNPEPREQLMKMAEKMLDEAERDHSVTEAQLLTARVYMIPEQVSPKEEIKRQELLQKLLTGRAARFMLWLGQERFYSNKKYRAAEACLSQYMKIDPTDVDAILNLGNAYNHSLMFKEADAAANHVVEHRLPLSQYGYGVLCQIKAAAALGNYDYQNSAAYAEKGFELISTDYMMSLWQLAAAHTGDVQRFYEASSKCRTVIPDKYARLQIQVDAVEAYALAKGGQRNRALELIGKWRGDNRTSGQVSRYWKQYPGGDDVSNNWKALLGTSE